MNNDNESEIQPGRKEGWRITLSGRVKSLRYKLDIREETIRLNYNT